MSEDRPRSSVDSSAPFPGGIIAVSAETVLYAAYSSQAATYHWLTHFLIGAAAALVVMGIAGMRVGRPVAQPALWVVFGHVVALFPDVLFVAGIAHQGWMDVFLGHVSGHTVPGGVWTLYVLSLFAVSGYLMGRLRVEIGH